jgi:hypothetical protein
MVTDSVVAGVPDAGTNTPAVVKVPSEVPPEPAETVTVSSADVAVCDVYE